MGLGLTLGQRVYSSARIVGLLSVVAVAVAACSDSAKDSRLPRVLTGAETAVLPEISLQSTPPSLSADPAPSYDGPADQAETSEDAEGSTDAPAAATQAAPSARPAVGIDKQARQSLKDIEKRLAGLEKQLTDIRPTLDRLILVENDIHALLDKMELIAYESAKAPAPAAASETNADKGTFSPSPLVPLAPLSVAPQVEQPARPMPLSAAPAPSSIDATSSNDKAIPTLTLEAPPAPQTVSAPPAASEAPTDTPAEEAPPPPTKQASPQQTSVDDKIGMHLATYSSMKNLERGWRILSGRFPVELGGLTSRTAQVLGVGGDATLYRLIAGPLSERPDALARCESLRAAEQYCQLKSF